MHPCTQVTTDTHAKHPAQPPHPTPPHPRERALSLAAKHAVAPRPQQRTESWPSDDVVGSSGRATYRAAAMGAGPTVTGCPWAASTAMAVSRHHWMRAWGPSAERKSNRPDTTPLDACTPTIPGAPDQTNNGDRRTSRCPGGVGVPVAPLPALDVKHNVYGRGCGEAGSSRAPHYNINGDKGVRRGGACVSTPR
jgi:hypothetical protein